MFTRIAAWLTEKVGGRIIKLAVAIVTIITAAMFTSITAEDVRAYHGAVAAGLMKEPRAGMLYRVAPGSAGSKVGGQICAEDHRPPTLRELKEPSALSQKTYVNWIGKTVPVGTLLDSGFSSIGVKLGLSHEYVLNYYVESRFVDEMLSGRCQKQVEAALQHGDLVCTVDHVIYSARGAQTSVFGVVFDTRAVAPLNAPEVDCPKLTHDISLYSWRSALVIEE